MPSYHICEFGVIRSLNDYNNADSSFEELYLSEKYFESVYNYISQNQDESAEAERPFSLFSKGKRKQIKVRNFVGIIETKEGVHLEILPKIHINQSQDTIQDTRSIFLKMLSHLKDSPFINISMAHIDIKKDFPILEVFIKSYIAEAERIFIHGVKSDYILHEDNVNYLKGKLKVNQNVKYNITNQARFYCEYSEYSQNIAANRIIKSTLIKLLKITNSYNNYYSINKILIHLKEVSLSSNIKADFEIINNINRLFGEYKTLLMWSEIFLRNKSFTNFRGDNLNLAILFPMEKVFEDYIAFLFKKYCLGYKIKIQDKSYFLVERHKEKTKFRLKPDIIIEQEENKKIIIDTKWKLLNQYAERRNYNISQADMYQLYAYGKKYSSKNIEPVLIMLYPSNPNFTSKLDNFIYEGDLVLKVIPFNLSESELDQKIQIENIIN